MADTTRAWTYNVSHASSTTPLAPLAPLGADSFAFALNSAVNYG